MKVTVAIDSFKGSLSTFRAGEAILEGIKQVYSDAEVNICPLADGGEGTVDAIIAAAGGEMAEVTVHNPIGDSIKSSYGIIPHTKTAVIEMSSAAGITLIDEKDRNPLNTTTFGVGELILDAVWKGCRKFIVGIGGSVTNDGGIGMLQALGFEFLDKNGNQVSFGAKGLKDIVEIKTDNALKELKECTFCVACDVKNILCGENGCSAIYGPQKGATPEMIKDMDAWLRDYAELTKKVLPAADSNIPGTGAAGGLGFAFLSYLNAALKSGVDLVIKETELEKYVKDADVVVTGEGRLDGQSYMGKAPIGVAKLAKKHNKPVIAFSGCVTDDAVICNEHGIDAFFPIVRTPCTLQEAMDEDNAYKNLRDTAGQVFRLIKPASELLNGGAFMSKKYFFSFIDDVIWVFRDLTRERPKSLFDNPFFKILKNAQDRYGLKTQLNLFYRTDYYYGMDEFNLSEMTDAYKAEFEAASDWLKLGFHSYQEFPDYPHVNSSYDDIYKLFNMIKDEVVRFAGEKSFTYGVVPHWVPVSFDGCRALRDCGAELVCVTVGGTKEFDGNFDSLPYGHAGRLLQNRKPETKLFTRVTKDVAIASSVCGYNHFSDPALFDNDKVIGYVTDEKTGLKFKKLDDNFDLNNYNVGELREELEKRKNDELICIGNHEQYFFSDYFAYEPDYADRIYEMAKILIEDERRECIFIEDLAKMS